MGRKRKDDQAKVMPAELMIQARCFTGIGVYGGQRSTPGLTDVATLEFAKGLVLIHQDDIDRALSLARQEARQQLLQEMEQTLGAVAQGGSDVRS